MGNSRPRLIDATRFRQGPPLLQPRRLSQRHRSSSRIAPVTARRSICDFRLCCPPFKAGPDGDKGNARAKYLRCVAPTARLSCPCHCCESSRIAVKEAARPEALEGRREGSGRGSGFRPSTVAAVSFMGVRLTSLMDDGKEALRPTRQSHVTREALLQDVRLLRAGALAMTSRRPARQG